MTEPDAPAGPDLATAQLATEIRRRRSAAQLSQPQLATMVHYSRQYISMAEQPSNRIPSETLIRALDHALGAEGALLRLRAKISSGAQVGRQASPAETSERTDVASWPGSTLRGASLTTITTAHLGEDHVLNAPAGRFFAGSTIRVKAYGLLDDERLLAAVPDDFAADPFLRQPRRGLVVGVGTGPTGASMFGLDTRHARRQLRSNTDNARLVMAPAYLLDDLTLGILWAVTNLDEPLLDDDALLAACDSDISMYEGLPRSAVGRDMARDLSTVSQMWLGSAFCARHILRHATALEGVPVFWTREQRGEEASTWLLFAHKYDYLRRTEAVYAGRVPPARIFCIPSSAVSSSTRPERILLLLATALMESCGIRVEVCVEPEYASVDGFVLDQRHRAIVANWVGAESIWQVDLTDSRSVLRSYAEVTGYARAHSIIDAPTPSLRLQGLADYLDVDWTWLARRCAELGDHGCAGLVEPRSRLLSLTGVDQACRYLGQIARTGS